MFDKTTYRDRLAKLRIGRGKPMKALISRNSGLFSRPAVFGAVAIRTVVTVGCGSGHDLSNHFSPGCPCRLAHGPGRMAHHGGTENPQRHHPNLSATPLARTQSGRKHMAIYTRQLAIQQGLRHLRRHRRGQLRGLEPPYRQALENHVHRTEKMGARRLIIRAVGIRRCVFRPVEGFENFAEHRGQAIHTVTSGRTECPGRKGR